VNFSATANQWEIYDSYVEELQRQQKEKEKEMKGRKKDEGKKKKTNANDLQGDDIGRVSRASKIVERMVNQNTFDAIAHDFKYWEDTLTSTVRMREPSSPFGNSCTNEPRG